jgi:hypothetical protein
MDSLFIFVYFLINVITFLVKIYFDYSISNMISMVLTMH